MKVSTELAEAVAAVSNSDLVNFEVQDSGATVRLTFSLAGFGGGKGAEWVVWLLGIKRLTYVRHEAATLAPNVVEAAVERRDAGDAPECHFRLTGEIELEAACEDVNVLKAEEAHALEAELDRLLREIDRTREGMQETRRQIDCSRASTEANLKILDHIMSGWSDAKTAH